MSEVSPVSHERPPTRMLRIGAWRVNPDAFQISREEETVRLEARAMRLLLYLADHAGKVVSVENLLNHVWEGVVVSTDSAYQAVATLRRLLGDDPKHPTYIATIPRLGYRMVASVSPWVDHWVDQNEEQIPAPRRQHLNIGSVLSMATVVCVAIIAILLFRGRAAINHPLAQPAAAQRPQRSVAVLPFLDLTEGMKQGEFADGMTEELIDKLSKIPGLHVPSPTASFYFKDKQTTIADIAKALGVVYVVDGSVRKSGDRLRVAARLIRVNSGYVIWSETYDRLFRDLLLVQDDIASEVTKALQTTLSSKTRTAPILQLKTITSPSS